MRNSVVSPPAVEDLAPERECRLRRHPATTRTIWVAGARFPVTDHAGGVGGTDMDEITMDRVGGVVSERFGDADKHIRRFETGVGMHQANDIACRPRDAAIDAVIDA